MKKSALRLPKLKTRDELLRTAPELGRFLAAGEGGDGAAPAVTSGSRARSPGPGKRAGSPRRLGRKFSVDEMTEEEHVRVELERVKAERATLLASLAKLRADQGKSGGELQQEDIRLLRRELEAKQEKLNELRRATHELTETMEQLHTESRDCDALMPQALPTLQALLAALEGDLAAVERDQVEAEAKHELYKLLEVRTRRDQAASEQRMRNARALKEGAADDFTVLTKQMHEMRAGREDAERELGGVVMVYDQVRGDWHKKLRDRRKEVRDLERRKAEEVQRKEQAAAAVAEKARLEADKSERSKAERTAANARLSAVVPELETLEATWARLHGICGAATADDLIAYWQELKAKEANMRELVRLAEVREARAKAEMAALLAARVEVFDSESARGARPLLPGEELAQEHSGGQAQVATAQQDAQPPASQEAAMAAEAASEGQGAAGEEDQGATASPAAAPGESREPTAGEPGAQQAQLPAEADSPVEAADTATPVAAATVPDAPAAPAAAAPEVEAEQLLREKQALIAEAWRRKATAREKFTKLSQVCVAADQGLHLLALRLKAAMEPTAGAERCRTSQPGSRRVTSNLRRRTSQQHQMVRRMSAANLAGRRGSISMLAVPDAASPRVAVGTRIHDKDFFPELPTMLTDVSGRLTRLMHLVEEMQSATEAAGAAGAVTAAGASAIASGEGSLLSSLGVTEASEAGVGSLLVASSRKLKWVDGQATPRVEAGQGNEEALEGEGEGGEEEGEDEAGTAAAAGERALRKGFQRCTWAGPAWLDAVTSGKPLTSTLRKQLGACSPGAPSSPMRRVVGHMEDGTDEAGSNPFDLADSSEDEEGAGGSVVDRQYLKHRAHKLAKSRAKAGTAGRRAGSPAIQVDAR